jgi:hypothetical protein
VAMAAVAVSRPTPDIGATRGMFAARSGTQRPLWRRGLDK